MGVGVNATYSLLREGLPSKINMKHTSKNTTENNPKRSHLGCHAACWPGVDSNSLQNTFSYCF